MFNFLFANRFVLFDLTPPLLSHIFPRYQTTHDPLAYLDLQKQLHLAIERRNSTFQAPYLANAMLACGHSTPHNIEQNMVFLSTSLNSLSPTARHTSVYCLHVLAVYQAMCKTNCLKQGVDRVPKDAGKPKHNRKDLTQTRGARLFHYVISRFTNNSVKPCYQDECSLSVLALSANEPRHHQKIVQTLQLLFEAMDMQGHIGQQQLDTAKASLHHCIPGLALGFRHQSPLSPSSAGYRLVGIEHNHWFLTVRVRKFAERKWLKPLRALFPATSATDSRHQTLAIDHLVRRIIVGHKFNSQAKYNPIDNRIHHLRGINDVLKHLPCGTNQILAMSVLLGALGSNSEVAFLNEYLSSDILLCDNDTQHSICKILSQMHRKCARSCHGPALSAQQVSQLAYLELAFGRSANTTDWDAERMNRCCTQHHIKDAVPPSVDREGTLIHKTVQLGVGHLEPDTAFYDKLRAKLDTIVPPLISPHHCASTFEQFYQRRHEWIASGSSAGFRMPVDPKLGKLSGAPVNKRAWAENHDIEHLRNYMTSQRPMELATASEKFENGKSRAIYGVAPEHYVINTYVTHGMEERLHKVDGLEKGASGLAELVYIAKRLSISADKTQECTMLDYADFNIHHTPQAQKILFDCIRQAGADKGASKDWLNATQWLVDAKLNQKVIFPGSQRPIKVTQGMFSGTRSTDLINTLLNLAYFLIANDIATELGVVPDDMYHVHQGDDVWLSSSNVIWGRLIFYILHNQGFIFQPSKQMFGVGRGEFLRVLYQQGLASGYLMRAVVNFLLRPLQNSMDIGAIEWANTATESCRMLHRRGLQHRYCVILWEDLIESKAKVAVHHQDHSPIKMPLHYITTPREFGGLGAMPPGYICNLTSAPTAPAIDTALLQNSVLEALPAKMTSDWIAYLSPKIHATFPSSIVRQFRAKAFKQTLVNESYAEQAYKQDERKILLSYKKRISVLAAASKPDGTVRRDHVLQVKNVAEVAQAMGWSASDPKCPEIRNKAYIPRSVAYSLQHPDKLVNPTKYSRALSRFTASSMFKTESRMAQAFGISRMQALALIMMEVSSSGSADKSLLALLAPIVRQGRTDLLDMLQKGGSSLFAVASTWHDARFTNYIASVASELLVTAAVAADASIRANPYQYMRKDYATMARLLSMPEYPAHLIKY